MPTITYHDEIMTLIDDGIEEGYMAQNITVSTSNANKFTIQRSREDLSMTILFSVPNLEYKKEILQLDKFLSALQVPIQAYLILDHPLPEIKSFQESLKTLQTVYDTYEEFGIWYGIKIIDGSLAGSLGKSLFLISRDGAVFYTDIPTNISEEINLQKLHIALNKAFTIYTGVGCHG
ncbi:MAG: hypothetical protein PHV08_02265 [Sulfurovaceae bacterium]|nr:hypothetical protein [Sulfurovaceae bacterium]